MESEVVKSFICWLFIIKYTGEGLYLMQNIKFKPHIVLGHHKVSSSVNNPVFVDDKKTRRQDQQTLHEAYQLLIKYFIEIIF